MYSRDRSEGTVSCLPSGAALRHQTVPQDCARHLTSCIVALAVNFVYSMSSGIRWEIALHESIGKHHDHAGVDCRSIRLQLRCL